jgi:nicotinamide-nucleotide amidase
MTLATVARFCGRQLILDTAMEATIAAIVARWMARFPDIDSRAIEAANRKQAMVPQGATVLHPVGTAPGVVVADGDGPTVIVLPGPPKELQGMWPAAVATEAVQRAIAGRTAYQQNTVRMFGAAESGLAETLRAAEESVPGFTDLEITTCLRRGELEMVTRYEPAGEKAYRGLMDLVRERHGATIFSEDGSTIDEQVAGLLSGRRIATAESCTAGMLAARLTDLAGSSAYVIGGVVAYANEAKVAALEVNPDLIAEHGAVSAEVAEAMAAGAIRRFGADTAVAITGVAGPGGGTQEKPVGTVWFCVMLAGGPTVTRRVQVPGERPDVRERSTTVAMHLLRRTLLDADRQA